MSFNRFLIWSSGSPRVQWSETIYHLCNFGRRHYGEQTCEVILNLDQWFRRRCPYKEKVYTRRTKTDHNSSHWAFGSAELKIKLLHSVEPESISRIWLRHKKSSFSRASLGCTDKFFFGKFRGFGGWWRLKDNFRLPWRIIYKRPVSKVTIHEPKLNVVVWKPIRPHTS